jgi:hypothetical protein
MASLCGPESGDRRSFADYATAKQKERALLDEKKKVEEQLKVWCQILSLLVIRSTNPATDSSVTILASTITEAKKKITDMVSTKSQLDANNNNCL